MNVRKAWVFLLLSFLVISIIPMASYASSSPTFTPPSNLKMGSFVADPEIAGGNATNLSKWFSMSWGINQAYQVGAVDYPYQFLYGDFFQNGQQVVQSVQVEFTINWTRVASTDPLGIGEPGWTDLGAFTGLQTGVFDTGEPGSSLGNYPVHVFYIQNSTVLEYNVTTEQGQSTYIAPSFIPTSASNGSFYIVIQAEYAIDTLGEVGQKGYRTIYVGEGEFNALNSHVTGKPTTSVNAGLTGASALLNWTFSAGEWNVTFVHFLNNNPADLSSSNIQVLQHDNFTYKQTGGIAHLRYNFSLNQVSGVYAWQFHEGITDYGTSFIVYNNITVQQSGDKPPMISIYIKPASQGGSEQISIYAKDAKNSSIFMEISVWYGNDIYTVPNATFENVIYYFAPANVTSGTNYTLPSFTSNFYGELNVEVLSENTYHQWNNSYASSFVKPDYINNGSYHFPGPSPSWVTSPFSSPLNALFLVAGIGLFIYSVHESGLEGAARRKVLQGLNAPFLDVRTHYLAAVLLFLLAFVNWSLLFTTITSWGGLVP